MSSWTCPVCGSVHASSRPEIEGERAAAALALARRLVVLLDRPEPPENRLLPDGAPHRPRSGRPTIQAVQTWIQENLRGDLSVAELARRAGMSQRNFTRIFVKELELTPGRFVDQARVEAACRLLDETSLPLQRVAFQSGFSGTQALRRALRRQFGVTPREYRDRIR